ncbi:MAG: TolC family protein [Mariprofundales bacterium]
MNRIFSVIILVFFCSITQAYTEELGLQVMVQKTLASHPQILAQQARVQAFQSSEQQVNAAWLPQASLAIEATHGDDPVYVFGSKLRQQRFTAADFSIPVLSHPKMQTNYATTLNIEWLLWAGGARRAGVQQAEAMTEAEQAAYTASEQQIIFTAIVAYANVQRTDAALQARLAALAAADEHVRISKQLLQQGMAIESDSLLAKVQQEQMQTAVLHSQLQQQNAQDLLCLLIRQKHACNINLIDKLRLPIINKKISFYVQQALDNQPNIHAQQARYEAGKKAQDISDARFYPSIGLMAQQQWHSNTPNITHANSMVGVQLKWNIFNGGADRAAQKRATSLTESQRYVLQDTNDQIALLARRAYRQIQEADSYLQHAKAAKQQAAEALRILKARRAQALASASDILDAQAQYNNAGLDVINARFQQVQTRAALMLQVGILDEELF